MTEPVKNTVEFIIGTYSPDEGRVTYKGDSKTYQAFKKHLLRSCDKFDITHSEGWQTHKKVFYLRLARPENLVRCKEKVTAYCTKRNIELTH